MDFRKLAVDMGNLSEKEVLQTVSSAALSGAENPIRIVEALSEGMNIVGEKFDELEYFVGDLIFAGEIFKEAINILQPYFPQRVDGGSGEKVILATVEGDIHDLGKNIVKTALRSRGFQVIDLGVNVSPAVIVQRTAEEKAPIVALSAVLTIAVDAMERTIAQLAAAGIRDQVTVVVGGGCLSEKLAKMIKADAYGKTPDDTAAICMDAVSLLHRQTS